MQLRLGPALALVLCFALTTGSALAQEPPATAAAPSQTAGPATDAGAPKQTSEPAAAPDSQAAEQLFWRATREYKAGNYAEAARLFQLAHEVLPEAELMVNVAMALAKNGQCEPASQAFGTFSAQTTDAALRDQATKKFAPVLAECQARKPPVSTQAPTPARESSKAESKHRPTDEHAPQQAPPRAWSTARVVGWTMLGLATVATGATVYADFKRRDAREGVLNANDEATYNEHNTEYERLRSAEITTAIVAGSLAVVGIGLLIVDWSTQQAAVSASVNPEAVTLHVAGRF